MKVSKPRRFEWFLIAGLALTGHVRAEECVDVAYSRLAKTEADCGKSNRNVFGVSEALCRPNIGGKVERKVSWCRPVAKYVMTYADCSAKYKVQPPETVSDLASCSGVGKDSTEVKALETTWNEKSCYVLEGDNCTKGAQVADGCKIGESVSAHFYYSPDCKLEAKVNANLCWVRSLDAEGCVRGGITKTLNGSERCKRESDANAKLSRTYFNDSKCTRARGAGTPSVGAIAEPKISESRVLKKSDAAVEAGGESKPLDSRKHHSHSGN